MSSFPYPPQPNNYWDFLANYNVSSDYECGQNQPTVATHGACPSAEMFRPDIPPTTGAAECVDVLHRRVIVGTCHQLPNSRFLC